MRDNVIRGSQYHGVFLFSGCDAVLVSNTVAANQRAGVFVGGTCQLRRNTFTDNLMSGVEVCRGHSSVHNNVFTRNGLLPVDGSAVASALNQAEEDRWSVEYMQFLQAGEPFPAVWFNNDAAGSTCGNIVNAGAGNSDGRGGWDDVHGRPARPGASSDILVEENCKVDVIEPAAAELNGSRAKQVGSIV
jgi:hypothetical protein